MMSSQKRLTATLSSSLLKQGAGRIKAAIRSNITGTSFTATTTTISLMNKSGAVARWWGGCSPIKKNSTLPSSYRRCFSSSVTLWNPVSRLPTINLQSSIIRLPSCHVGTGSSSTATSSTTISSGLFRCAGATPNNGFILTTPQRRGMASKKHKRIVKAAKGYRGRANRCYRIAIRRVEKAMQYAYRDRKIRKRDFRKLWIMRINAGVNQHGLRYNKFIQALNKSPMILDRKVLANLAYNEPFSFKAVVDVLNEISSSEEQKKSNVEDNDIEEEIIAA